MKTLAIRIGEHPGAKEVRLTKVDLVFREGGDFLYLKVGRVATGALLDAESSTKFLPNLVLPLDVVFLHRAVVIALAKRANTGSAGGRKVLVELTGNGIEVLVGFVAQTEADVFHPRELVLAVLERERFVGEAVHQGDGIVGWLTLAVGGHEEDGDAVLREGVEVVKVVFFGVANERGEAKLLLSFLGEADGILLRSPGLGPVEDDETLVLYQNQLWTAVNSI
jgi:hypothetical protein